MRVAATLDVTARHGRRHGDVSSTGEKRQKRMTQKRARGMSERYETAARYEYIQREEEADGVQ